MNLRRMSGATLGPLFLAASGSLLTVPGGNTLPAFERIEAQAAEGHSAASGPGSFRATSADAATSNTLQLAAVGRSALAQRTEKRIQATEGAAAEQVGESAKQPKPESGDSERVPRVTPEREAAALMFVQQHHPELSRLLDYLERHRPRQYAQAIAELFRTSERLAQVQERDYERYELELEAWKIRSRVQLLTARLTMARNDALREQLEAALQQQWQLKLRLLERDRDRAADRVERLERQMERWNANREQIIERQMNALLRQSDPARGRRAPARSERAKQSAGDAQGSQHPEPRP